MKNSYTPFYDIPFLNQEGEYRMKLTTIEYFIAVAESGSIRAAAQRLYIAQPSLTKAIQLMEEELGVRLFNRTNAGIQLTGAGETILPQARQMVAMYNHWLELGSNIPLKKISIYSHISLTGFLVPDILLQFRESYPELTVNYYTDAEPERFLSSDLQEPTLILGLNYPNADMDRKLKAQGHEKIVLTRGGYGCLVNSHSPLAEKDSVCFDDLKDYCLAFTNQTLDPCIQCDDSSSAISRFVRELVKTISTRNVVEVGTVNSVIDLVSQHPYTFAVSFAPVNLRYPGVQTGELVHIPMQASGVEAELQLIYSRNAYSQHPAFRNLVSCLCQEMDAFLERYAIPGPSES